LGIAAPALLASLVNGFTNPENKSISLIIPKTALVLYAQDNNIDLTPKLLQLEKDNAFTQVLQGALGREAPPKNNFIVLEKCISLDSAKNSALIWANKFPQQRIEIYRQPNTEDTFYVTAGSFLSTNELSNLELKLFPELNIDINKVIQKDVFSNRNINLSMININPIK
jgi:hypothetical protein